jgi:hypothetical protein
MPCNLTASHEARHPCRGRAASLFLIEAATGGLITVAPGCPRWASLAVDRLTLRHDRVRGVEVVL